MCGISAPPYRASSIYYMINTGRVKIALVAPSLPPFATDGISSSHYNLYLLLKDVCEVKVFTYNDPAVSVSVDPDIIRNGLSDCTQKLVSGVVRLLLLMLGARGIVYQFRDALLGALIGRKLIDPIMAFGPDITIVPDQGPPSAFWPKAVAGKILFVSHHNSMRFHREPLLGTHSGLDAKLGRYLEQLAVGKADLVVCPSRYMKDIFAETYRFSGPVEVIPNMIDGSGLDRVIAAPLRERLQLPPDAPIVYIPSAGSIYKGRSFVARIIQRLFCEYDGKIGFYLSGHVDADQQHELVALPVHAVIYTPGTVPHHENMANIKACTLCVSPTIVENFSMALLEAQWFGLPVISFDIGGNRDVVLDGSTGFLVPFPDYGSLVDQTLMLLRSPKQVAQLSKTARVLLHRRFDPPVMQEMYLRLFTRLVRTNDPG